MSKKIITMVLLVSVVSTLAACGKETKTSSEESVPSTQSKSEKELVDSTEEVHDDMLDALYHNKKYTYKTNHNYLFDTRDSTLNNKSGSSSRSNSGSDSNSSYNSDYSSNSGYNYNSNSSSGYSDSSGSAEYSSDDTDSGSETSDSEYIFPNSDSEYLTKADLKGMDFKEINLAKNELYARHGRMFATKELQDYFDSCSWYAQEYTPEEWDEFGDAYFFNDYEIKNRNLLKKREDKLR